MTEFNNFLTALSGFAWPAFMLAVGLCFRGEMKSLFLQFQRQLASGAALKWKDFEFRAIQIDPLDLRDGSEYVQEPLRKTSLIGDTRATKKTRTCFSCTERDPLASFIRSTNCRPMISLSICSLTRTLAT